MNTAQSQIFSSTRWSIERTLASYVHRQRTVAAARALILAAAAVTTWCVIACVVDRYAGFSRPVRVIIDAISAVTAAALLRPVVRPARRRFDRVAAAAAIEVKIPTLAGRLTTAVSAPVEGTSPQMLATITDQAAGDLPRKIHVSIRPLVFPAVAAIAAFVCVITAFRIPRLDMPGLIHRFAHPLTVLPAVTATHLIVLPTPASVPVGQPLRIACTATPIDSGAVILHVSDDAGKTWTTWPMTADTPSSTTFSYTWAAVTGDLRFFISAGDATGPAAFVTASAKPMIVEFRTRIEPPKYLHRPVANTTSGDAVIDAVDGSAVTVDVVCSRPIWRLRALTQGRDTENQPTADPAIVRYPLVVRGDQKIELRPIGADGQAGDFREIEIRAQPDRPPTVRFLDPIEVSLVGADWKIDGGYEAADDFGLTSVTTDVRVDDRRPGAINRPIGNGPKISTVEDAVDFKPLGLVPGDVVTVHVRAKDDREPNPQSAATEAHYFLVVPEPGDPKDGKRFADLTAAQNWTDRLATDSVAATNVRICLQRAATHAESPRFAGFVAELAGRPAESIRADLKTLLAGERASELIRLKAALSWIDGRGTPERNGSERQKARDRLSARIEVESQKLGVPAGTSDTLKHLRGFQEAVEGLLRARTDVQFPVISANPAINTIRPPEVLPAQVDTDSGVPGYEEAVRLYLNRINPSQGK